jgi:hypothetical protein
MAKTTRALAGRDPVRRTLVALAAIATIAALVGVMAASGSAAGTTTRLSVNSAGEEGNNSSNAPSISSDGHHVVFQSEAGNLVEGDTNSVRDIFVRDRQSGATERVSVAGSGAQGNFDSRIPSISPDGRYVAFESDAANLVEDPDTNGSTQIFVHERSIASPDTTAPTVTSVSPLENTTKVPRSTSFVTVIFSEQMKATSLDSPSTNFKLQKPTGKGKNATYEDVANVVVNSQGIPGPSNTQVTRATLTLPSGTFLDANTTYKATVTKGAKDLADNALSLEKVWTFKTGSKSFRQ